MNNPGAALKRASALIQQGRLGEARAVLIDCLAAFPEQADSHQMLAMIDAKEGKLEDAAGHGEAYLRKRPRDVGAWYNLGFIRQQQGSLPAALDAYRRARDLDPRHLPTLVNMAQVLEGLGDARFAIEILEERLRAEPAQAFVANALASLLLRQERAPEARVILQNVLDHDPKDPLTWINLGIAQSHSGNLETAVDAYRRALTLRPEHSGARLNLAKALSRLGDLPAALTEVDREIVQRPRQAEPHSARSVILERLGRSAEALEAARLATRLNPRDANAQYNLASLLSKRTGSEDLAAAAAAAGRSLELDPTHAAAHQCLALVLAKQGHLSKAVERARSACELEARAEHRLTLGNLLADAGRLTEARAVLEDSCDAHPKSPMAHRQLGITLLKMKFAAEALESLEVALALDPGDQRSIAHRAAALQQLGRNAEATAYLGLDEHIYAPQLALPQGFSDLETFNRQLAEDIRNHSQLRWEPIGLAARNGGLTDDLTADRTPAILGFVESLRLAIEELRCSLLENPADPFLRSIPGADYRLNLWATLVEEGGNIDTHIHEESWLSGAYYVALPDTLGRDPTDPAGWIEFGRPHRDIFFPEQAATRLYRPQAGLLLLFPSYLFHRTIPHRGTEQRISISFDLSQPTGSSLKASV